MRDDGVTSMIKTTKLLAMAVAGIVVAGTASAACDMTLGKKQFRKCKACHKLVDGKNGVGPHLFNVVGRKAATVEKYKYSKAMKKFAAAGGVWDEATLDKFLVKPKKLVKGTKMAMAGIRKEKQRAAIICYLATFK